MRMRLYMLPLVLAAGAVVGCGRPRDIERRPEAVLDFPTLYASNCAGCHGVNGRSGAAQRLNDPVYLAMVNETRLRDVIARGIPSTPMPAFAVDAGGSLTSDQVAALASGLKASWGPRAGGRSVPSYSEDEAIAVGGAAGDSSRGGIVFTSYCARCHGDDGRGGPTAGSVVDRAYLALTSNQAIRTAVIVGQAEDGAPGWRDAESAHELTNQEITDVVAWIASHRGRDE